MTEPIIFVDPPTPRVDDAGVVFFAQRGSQRFKCLVTEEFLLTRFGPQARRDPLKAYEEHKPTIHAIARSHIANGRVSDENEIRVESDSFALKDVTFSKSVRESPEYHRVLQATAFLEDVLGQSAPLVTAAWDRKAGSNGHSVYSLTLRDFTGTATREFSADILAWPQLIEIGLYGLWGDLLQIRSNIQHRKVEELVAALTEE
jgi:Protein of unknown function (DUF1488)